MEYDLMLKDDLLQNFEYAATIHVSPCGVLKVVLPEGIAPEKILLVKKQVEERRPS